MTTEKQSEALLLAEVLIFLSLPKYQSTLNQAGNELRRQHARIAELESQLESIGAGGVSRLVAQANAEPVEPINPDILNLKCESSDTSEASIRRRYQQRAIAPELVKLTAEETIAKAAFDYSEGVDVDFAAIAAEVRGQLAELDALQADAARYEFIRVNGVYHLQFERGECGTGVYLGAAADQAIDAAIKEAKP